MSEHRSQKQKTNEKMMELMLEYAGACHVEDITVEMDTKCQSSDQISYPPELDTKVKKLIADYNKSVKRKKLWKTSQKVFTKVAVFIFIVILGISILAVGVEAFRGKLLNFIVEIQEEYTKIEVKDNNDDLLDDISNVNIQDWDDLYLPTYIPKGFSPSITEDTSKMINIHYSNTVGDTVIFSQYKEIGTDLKIDTQDADTEVIIIQGEEGILAEKDGDNSIVWHNHESAFIIRSTIDKEELIKMAESIEKNR